MVATHSSLLVTVLSVNVAVTWTHNFCSLWYVAKILWGVLLESVAVSLSKYVGPFISSCVLPEELNAVKLTLLTICFWGHSHFNVNPVLNCRQISSACVVHFWVRQGTFADASLSTASQMLAGTLQLCTAGWPGMCWLWLFFGWHRRVSEMGCQFFSCDCSGCEHRWWGFCCYKVKLKKKKKKVKSCFIFLAGSLSELVCRGDFKKKVQTSHCLTVFMLFCSRLF